MGELKWSKVTVIMTGDVESHNSAVMRVCKISPLTLFMITCLFTMRTKALT